MTAVDGIARALPGVEQGIACAGTALESRTFRVKKKAFLFLTKEHARFKLAGSIADARKRGAEVGAGGWARIGLGELPARAVLAKWIAESHALVGGSEAPVRPPAKSKAARKRKPAS